MQSLFSDRLGFSNSPELQIDTISDTLKTRIWNSVDEFVLVYTEQPLNINFYRSLWTDFFKYSITHVTNFWGNYYNDIYLNYYQLEWYDIYGFIEFIIRSGIEDIDLFTYSVNNILKEENAAYRIIGETVARITDEFQIEEVQKVIQSRVVGAKEHIQNAISKLSDKKNPDYRNSIKESISAVESMSKYYSKNDNGTLGSLIEYIDKNSTEKIPKSLTKAFKKLYGYTSSEGGIRHGMLDKSNIKYHDALFMLVICSAFINYCEQTLDQQSD